MSQYFGGLDFGSSGARISIISNTKDLIYAKSSKYEFSFQSPKSWINSCESLLYNLPTELKTKLSRISISGTSGTLLACQSNGMPLGDSIPYNQICNKQIEKLVVIANNDENLKSPFSSLSKALTLVDKYGTDIILRHQSDWISGWILNNWKYGEEGNNIKLGWNISKRSWPENFESIGWRNCLPIIVKSGSLLGKINQSLASKLKVNKNLLIVAGTTDSNASFIAAGVNTDEGLTVLGTTLVLKKNIKKPIKHVGITSHRINDQWICGGSSNAGCGVLSKFFSDMQIEELSKQINPHIKTNLNFIPLNCKGERFPTNNPLMEPLLKPRPVSDALFLQGILEGLAAIELKGWKKLEKITGSYPKRIITIGGGAKNSQWRAIRRRILNIPITSSNKSTSYGSALIALSSKK